MDLSAYRQIQQKNLTDEQLKKDLEYAKRIDASGLKAPNKIPIPKAGSQSNNTPSVQQQTGGLPKMTQQQFGLDFNKPQPIPQNPYAKPTPLPYANKMPSTLPRADAQIMQRAKQVANLPGDSNAMYYATAIKSGLGNAAAGLQNFYEIGKLSDIEKMNGEKTDFVKLGQNVSKDKKLVDNIATIGNNIATNLTAAGDRSLPSIIRRWLTKNFVFTDEAAKRAGYANKEAMVDAVVNKALSADNWNDEIQQDYADLYEGRGGGQKIAGTIIQAMSQMAPSILSNMVLPGSGLPMMAGEVYGNSAMDALNQGATLQQAKNRGVLSAATEVGTEKLFGGIPGLNKGLVKMGRVGDILGEGVEEGLSTAVSGAIDRATFNPNAEDASWKDIGLSALVGAATSGVMNVPGAAVDTIAQVRSGEVYKPARGESEAAARMAGQLDRVYGASKMEGEAVLGSNTQQDRSTITRREQRALDALSAKTGVNIQIDDDIKGSNGYFDRNTNTLHISRNSNNAVYQVAAHEIAHFIESNPEEWNQLYEIANANLSEDARSKLEYVLQKTGYTDAEMQSEVVSHYVQQCVTDIKSFEQLVGVNRNLAQRIVDAFESFVRKLTGQQGIGGDSDTQYLREIMGDITPEQAQQTLAQMKKALGNTTESATTVEPSVSYSLKGINQYGIEVYETSEDTKKMSFTDRKKAAKALVEDQYAGRTAKFLRNGHWDYAVFEKNIGKNLYNDTVSDGQGYNAKLNAFADGDVFTLVENSKYDDSKPEQKSHNADHWDYYVKTVQIDNRVYDVLVNIKYGYGKMKNIYSITLKENKKISPTAPVQNQESSADLGGQSAYLDFQYTQNNPVVNTQNSLKLSPEVIKQNADTAEQYYGTTINPKIAGYLTVNGRMLDFSGKKFGAPGGYRTVDHRDIRDALGLDYGGEDYSGSMVQFMSEGNIRLAPESGGINLSVKPNKVQEDQLARYIRTFGGEIIIDFDSINGDTVGSVEYPARTPASLILQEIRDYFDKGKMPENFDYSRKLNREALQEMAERSRTGIPYAPGYVPKQQPKQLPPGPAMQQPQQIPYAPGYKAENSPSEPTLPRAKELTAQEAVSAINKELKEAERELRIAESAFNSKRQSGWMARQTYAQMTSEIEDKRMRVISLRGKLETAQKPVLPYNPNAPIPQNPAQSSFGSNTVGSAQVNPSSYAHLQNQYGTVEPGENPARVVDVPKKDAEGNTVSLFARTGMESQHMPDELVEPFEQAVASGEFSHAVFSDREAKHYAEEHVAQGFDHAWSLWRAVADGTKVATKKDIALGELLLANAMKDKRVDLAIQLTAELCAEATRAGQTVQAFRLLKKMTPEGQLFYLQKVTDKLNKQYEGRKGFDGIKLNEGLVKELSEATTKEAVDKAIDKIKQDIADQTPVTFEDRWNAWRYLAMLGNVRTQVRNVLGNFFFWPVVKTKNLIATGIERAAGKRLPERTKALLNPKKDKALIDYGKNDFENVKDEVSGGDKYTEQQDILSKRRIFRLENIERARVITHDIMEWGDRIFSKSHYATSLAAYMKANNLNPDTITPEQLNKARNYAIKEAQKATFRDSNAFASFLNANKKNLAARSRNANTTLGKVGWKLGEAVAEGVVPFTKTPANIMARGVEYSPLGLAYHLISAKSSIKSGKKTAAEVIDGIAAGLTGTALAGLGALLAAMGTVTGAAGDEKEDKYKKMLGEQEYSLKLGDDSYTIDWLAPAALPFFTGVALYDSLVEPDKISFPQLLDALSTIGEPMFELSMLQGINDALGASKYSDQAPVISLLSNAAFGYAGQVVPTSFGQVARAVDKTRRQTYYNPNYKGAVKEGLAVGQKQLAKIPFASKALQPSIDMWGREQENEGGSFVGRLAYNMLSPGYASTNKATHVDKELLKLHESTGENSVLPSYADKAFKLPADNGGESVRLTAKEYTEYAKAKGSKAYDIFDSVIGTKNWNSLSDEDKVAVAGKVYEYANALAKSEVSDYTLRDTAAKFQRCEKAGIPAGVAIVAYVAQKDIKGDKDSKGNTISLSASKNKKEAIDRMTPFITKKQRELLYELFEVSEKVW